MNLLPGRIGVAALLIARPSPGEDILGYPRIRLGFEPLRPSPIREVLDADCELSVFERINARISNCRPIHSRGQINLGGPDAWRHAVRPVAPVLAAGGVDGDRGVCDDPVGPRSAIRLHEVLAVEFPPFPSAGSPH